MVKPKLSGLFKIILLITAFASFIVFTEFAYAYKHREVLSRYILKSAKFVSSKGKTDLAFRILTQGRLKIPNDNNFRDYLKGYLEKIPDKRDLPRVNYDLALYSYKSGLSYLTPKLLEVSIDCEPDFSFWRVELANYYLSIGGTVSAEKTLDDCIMRQRPSLHCSDFKNDNLDTDLPEEVGFLKDAINKFYETKTF